MLLQLSFNNLDQHGAISPCRKEALTGRRHVLGACHQTASATVAAASMFTRWGSFIEGKNEQVRGDPSSEQFWMSRAYSPPK